MIIVVFSIVGLLHRSQVMDTTACFKVYTSFMCINIMSGKSSVTVLYSSKYTMSAKQARRCNINNTLCFVVFYFRYLDLYFPVVC